MRPCPFPPSKLIVLEELETACRKKDLVYPITDLKLLPDQEWALNCLSTLEPNHLFFSKNYMPPPKIREDEVRVQVPNADDLFTDLPLPKGKTSRSSLPFLDKVEMRQLKINRAKKQQEKMNQRLDKLIKKHETKLEEDKVKKQSAEDREKLQRDLNTVLE